MKKMTMIIAIACIAVCLLGWLSFALDEATASSEQKNYIEQADTWVEAGLYQRAIKNYQEAQKTEDSLELCKKIANAYALRYAEAEEETYDDYLEALEGMVAKYPADEEFVVALANLYFKDESYTDAYTCLKNAADLGCESVQIYEMMKTARYAYRVSLSYYSGTKEFSGNAHIVAKDGKWGVLDAENGMTYMCDYLFVSQPNDDGVFLITNDKDSRLIDGEGMVLGIFKEKITDAGIFADGLIAVSSGVEYSYYDEFAQKMFGGYEAAGTFCGGQAAVKQDGKWVLVNTAGESVSDSFAEIVLNEKREHISNGLMLAAESKGKYKIYDQELQEVAALDCEAVDILTPDGVIAVCKNGKWGFANTNGEMVIEPQYEAARSFYNGLAAVCQNGRWGFINGSNEIVIQCQFTDVTYFNYLGEAMVRVDEPRVETEEDTEESLPDEAEPMDTTGEELAQEPETEVTEAISGSEPEETAVEEPTEGEAAEEIEKEDEIVQEWQMLSLYNGITEG